MPSLEVVRVEEKRDIIPLKMDQSLEFTEMAVGMTYTTMFVRGPSGTLYACRCPIELAVELGV